MVLEANVCGWCCTVDDGARVKAAVLLAPVGSNAGALWEVAHGRGLHINDLHIQNEEPKLTTCTHSPQSSHSEQQHSKC